MRALVLLIAVSLVGCRPEHMKPGSACGSCHGVKPTAPPFGVAGTLHTRAGAALEGASIHVTDAAGVEVWLQSNEVGNFFATTPLTPPLAVIIAKGGATLSRTEPGGDCNACHARSAAAGRLELP